MARSDASWVHQDVSSRGEGQDCEIVPRGLRRGRPRSRTFCSARAVVVVNEAYPDVQIEALQALLGDLQSRCPHLIEIAGHEDLYHTEVPASDDPTLQVRRKRDPGPLFPWSRVVARSGLRRFGELLPPP